MKKKPGDGTPDEQVGSPDSQEDEAFSFEMFGDDDDEETAPGGDFAHSHTTRKVEGGIPSDLMNGAYRRKPGIDDRIVEDLAPPRPDRAGGMASAEDPENALGRVNLHTIDPRVVLRQRAVEKLAEQAAAEEARLSDPDHRSDTSVGSISASLDEPLPPWFEDADSIDIAWPWEEEGGSPEPEEATGLEESLSGEVPVGFDSLNGAEPVGIDSLVDEDPMGLESLSGLELVSMPEPPPPPPPTPAVPPPTPAAAMVATDAKATGAMRAAMDGMVKAALDDWVEEPSDPMSGFDSQPTARISDKKLNSLGQYLERVAPQSQDVTRVLLPAQAPLPPELDQEMRMKVEEARALFQNIHVVLQSLWVEGGSQTTPGGPIVLDMAMVGPAYDWLGDLLQRRGELRLELSPYELLLHGRTVMRSEVARDNPFFHLYQEGVRLLVILPGLTEPEFKELFRVLSWSPSAERLEDATTGLWSLDLPHLRIASTGATAEQLLGGDEDLLEEHVQLVHTLNRTLHGEQAFTDPGESAAGKQAPGLLDQVLRLRLELVRSLEQVPGQDALRQVRGQVETLGPDQVQRLVHILLELMGTTSHSALFGGASVELLQHLMVLGRWDVVGTFCHTLRAALGRKNPDQVRRAAALLQGGLTKLLDRQVVAAMEPALATIEAEELEGLRELVRVLPSSADPGLVMLAEHVHDKEVKQALQGLVEERGVNVVAMFARRLRSEKDDEVLEGIEVLRTNPTRAGLEAIRGTLGHANTQVRIKAFEALEDHLGDALIPDLIDSLTLDDEGLRDACLAMLGRVRPGVAARQLIPLLDKVARAWSASQRKSAVAILARAGNNSAYGFLVKQITMRNLLRDAAVEDFRHEVLDCLVENGGLFSRKVLTDCVNQNWTFGSTKAAIQDAIDRLSNRS